MKMIYIDPPFNSNRNFEVFWGDVQELITETFDSELLAMARRR
jgi:hypothetical protein